MKNRVIFEPSLDKSREIKLLLNKFVSFVKENYGNPIELKGDELNATFTADELETLGLSNPIVNMGFGYYFEEGASVVINESCFNGVEDPFLPFNHMKQYFGVVGEVLNVEVDMHAFGRGSTYNVDVKYGDKILTNIPATYFIAHE